MNLLNKTVNCDASPTTHESDPGVDPIRKPRHVILPKKESCRPEPGIGGQSPKDTSYLQPFSSRRKDLGGRL